MSKSERVLPHYCTHAAEFFTQLARDLPLQLGMSSELEAFFAQYLQEAVKFILPGNGYLFADHDFKPTMFELQRLPYPQVALEFTADSELYAEGSGLEQSNKRIALCFDPHQLPEVQKQRLAALHADPEWESWLPEQALGIMAVFEAQSVWSAAVGMVVIDLENDHPRTLSEVTEQSLRSHVVERAAALGRRTTKHGLPALFRTFPSRSAYLGITVDAAVDNLYIDTIDETRTVYEFLAAINCSNVGSQVITAPRMLNEKRKKKGKVPFFEYHVLDIDPFQDRETGAGDSGAHASPRTHLRRGHLRRLGEKFGHKVLWINATVVNPSASEGAVNKDYRVRGKDAR